MQVIESVAAFRQAHAAAAKPLGLVPTMGFLHEGHMALVRRARKENASVAVSIFVNPTQFGPSEDFETYPRDMDADLAQLDDAGVDLVFAPPVEEVYPPGFDTFVDVGRIGERLEGEHRAGHFRGVATVVCKLLTIVRPDRAYFGQKDAQQCLVVKRLNARPESRRGNRCLPNGARPGRSRAEQPQCVSQRIGARGGIVAASLADACPPTAHSGRDRCRHGAAAHARNNNRISIRSHRLHQHRGRGKSRRTRYN